MFWGDFSEQILGDTPQGRKLDEIGELLLDGAQIELGCCGDEHCHGHKIREALIDWVDDRHLPPPPAAVDWLNDLLDPLPQAPFRKKGDGSWEVKSEGCWNEATEAEAHETIGLFYEYLDASRGKFIGPIEPPVIHDPDRNRCFGPDEPVEPWQTPHLVKLEGWLDQSMAVLGKHWGDLPAFDVEITEETAEHGYKIIRTKAGDAVKDASTLLMKFDVASKDLGCVTEDNLPEYLASYLCWGALQAHIDQGEGPYHQQTLKDSFQQFEARVVLWREFRYLRAADSKGDIFTCPVTSVESLRDWVKRGRPDSDAPVVKLNGEMVQADVGQIMKVGLEELEQSGLGGADLTAKLLNLAVTTGQPFHSIEKAWKQFCGGVIDKEMFVSVLDEMLKGEEPMISVEELAGPDFQKQVIDDFQRQFDCDPMLVLLTVMSAMGTVLPLRTKVRGLSHTQHWRPGILFVVILVVSGGMKSMLLEELVEKPIVGGSVGFEVKQYAKEARAALKAMDKENGDSSPAFTGAHQWTQEWANTIGSQSPADLMHVVSDFTGEGIDRNAKQNDDFPGYRIGTLLTTDEGRQLMGGDRYKSGGGSSAGSKYTLDKLKRAWDGKGPSSVRGNKSLERNYERIRLAILAFIQPEIYDEIASDESDDACGFWPRFLAYEAAPVQLRDDLTPADRRHIAANSTFRKYLDDLYASIYSLHLVPLTFDEEVLFHFSEQAEDWWYPIQCKIGRDSTRETASGDGVMGRLLGKLPALVVDVSLLLHLLKLKGAGHINTDALGQSGDTKDIKRIRSSKQDICTIPLETVQAAYTLCRQLMLRTAKQRNRAQGDGSGDRAQFLVKVQATAQKLDPEQKGIPVGQLQKGWNGAYLKKHPETKDLIYQALGALSDRGLGELTLSSGNNRGFRYRWIKPVVV